MAIESGVIKELSIIQHDTLKLLHNLLLVELLHDFMKQVG